jgi:hypothetical protein
MFVVVVDVSGRPVNPILKAEAKNVTERSSRSFGKYSHIQTFAVEQPTRGEVASALLWKPEIHRGIMFRKLRVDT